MAYHFFLYSIYLPMKVSVIPLNHRAIFERAYSTTNNCREISMLVVEKKKLKKIASSVEFVLLIYQNIGINVSCRSNVNGSYHGMTAYVFISLVSKLSIVPPISINSSSRAFILSS